MSSFLKIPSKWVLLWVSIMCISNVGFAQQSSEKEEYEREGNILERQKYFYERLHSGPDLDVEASRKEGLRQFVDLPNYFTSKSRGKAARPLIAPAWQQVGGSQDSRVSGRATGVAFDPKNSSIVYLATTQGGLWKTTDHGGHWSYLSSTWSNTAMGSVGVDPNNSQVVYAGTGDADFSESPEGDGIYKSTDGGLNWQKIVSSKELISIRTYQIMFNPKSPLINGETSVVYQTGTAGVSKSTDAGKTWTKVYKGSAITSMVMNPNNPDTLLIATSGQFRRSFDGGKTWERVGSNISGAGRMTLAIAQSNPAIIYASIATPGGQTLGVAKSTDNGTTWALTNQTIDVIGQQGMYANAIAVNPTNPNDVVAGGLDIFRSTDGGKTFKQTTDWTLASTDSRFSHADIHILTYANNKLYTLSDGGIYYSSNNGVAWRSTMNQGLSTLQFVGIDADPNFTFVIGGTQDNGVNRGSVTGTTFDNVGGGDGGRSFVSPADPKVVYSTYYSVSLRRSTDGGLFWYAGGANVISNFQMYGEGSPFYMDYSVSAHDAGTVLAVCNRNLFLSTDYGDNFEAITDPDIPEKKLNGSPSTAHISTADPNVFWASTKSRFIYVTTDQGATWSASPQRIGIASSFATDPNDPKRAFVCFLGQGGRHFAYTTDMGVTWQTPDTNLPNLSCNAIALGPNGELFIANDFGVVFSLDTGKSWWPLREGLPLVEVKSLVVRGTTPKYLLAGTYGRGAFKIDLTDILSVPRVDPMAEVKPQVAADSKPEIVSVYPNPVVGARHSTVEYSLPSSGNVRLAVHDVLGREVQVAQLEYISAGRHTASVDVSTLAAGNYYYVLTVNGIATITPFTVQR